MFNFIGTLWSFVLLKGISCKLPQFWIPVKILASIESPLLISRDLWNFFFLISMHAMLHLHTRCWEATFSKRSIKIVVSLIGRLYFTSVVDVAFHLLVNSNRCPEPNILSFRDIFLWYLVEYLVNCRNIIHFQVTSSKLKYVTMWYLINRYNNMN